MKYVCTLIAVKNMEKSKKFYHDILDQDVIEDLGATVTLTGGFALQAWDSWECFIRKIKSEITYGDSAAELNFEEDDMDSFIARLQNNNIEYVHPPQKHSWGQRVVRFYDLDNHMIEVSENMKIVVKRFIDSGLTIQQTAKRMDVSVDFIEALLS